MFGLDMQTFLTSIESFWKTLAHRLWYQHPFLYAHGSSHSGYKDLLFYWSTYNNGGIWMVLISNGPYGGKVMLKMSCRIYRMSCRWIDQAFLPQLTLRLWYSLYNHAYVHSVRIYLPKNESVLPYYHNLDHKRHINMSWYWMLISIFKLTFL